MKRKFLFVTDFNSNQELKTGTVRGGQNSAVPGILTTGGGQNYERGVVKIQEVVKIQITCF
jgi:hypothetical protein